VALKVGVFHHPALLLGAPVLADPVILAMKFFEVFCLTQRRKAREDSFWRLLAAWRLGGR
jgi:hypothetical protein